MKKCFTINPFRKTEDFLGYRKLLEENIYQAIEIFFPYNLKEEDKNTYYQNVLSIHKDFPDVEVVMHLPHGTNNSLCLENYQENLMIMKQGILFTKDFDTRKLTLHLGGINQGKDINRNDYIVHIIKVLKELCSFAKDYNMNVMIENMPRDNELGYSPDEILAIISGVNMNNLKFILDTGHANVSDYSINEYVNKLSKYLYHLHFSDNKGISDEHKPLGYGNIDFKHFLELLRNINYQELYCLEILFNTSDDLIKYASDLDKYN